MMKMSSGRKSRFFLLMFIFIMINMNGVRGGESERIVLKSATEYDYPPFSVTSVGKPDGFSVELLKAVVEEIGMDIEFKIDTWDTIKTELKDRKLDVLPIVGYNKDRDKYFDFTVPYMVMHGNIFVRKGDEGSIKSEDELDGKTLIVMKGDNVQEYAIEKGWTEHLILTDTYVEAFELLDSGKGDAVLAQSIVGESIINDLQLENIVPVYTFSNEGRTKVKVQLTGLEQKFCFAVVDGNANLLARLNEGLAIVSENGTYDRLYKEWFPFLVDDKPDILEVIKMVAIMLVPILLLFLLISFRIIRRQVREKTQQLEAQNERIKYVSYHDGLTGLYNRRFFDEELMRLDKSKYYPLTILVADVNGLKLVNDTLGHYRGDEMIKRAAEVLQQACRDSDVVIRWGGDEFVCLLPNTSEKTVREIVEKIKHMSQRFFNEYGVMLLSMGYETKNDDSTSIIELFKTAEEHMYKDKLSESEGVRGHLIDTILNTLFEKSPRDRAHSERVCELATKLAEKMELRPSVVADIKTIGLLHDIGKIVVPQSLLDKNERLDDQEWEQIRQHPTIGYRILSTSKEFAHIARGVLHHHERIDGKGYPERLSAEAIPIESRVISVVDAYDAMTAYRPYKDKTMSVREAAAELKRNINIQFDEQIVRRFLCDVLELDWELIE